MNAKLTFVALALIPCVAMAQTKPDGVLSSNTVTIYGSYDHYSVKGGDAAIDYTGYGIAIGHELFANDLFAVNGDLDISHVKDNSGLTFNEYTNNSITPSITCYRDMGMVSPFVSVKFEYSQSSYSEEYEDGKSTWGGLALGAEFHMVPGFYVTPQIILWERLNANFDACGACADFQIETGYWVSEKTQLFASALYESASGGEQVCYRFGMRMSY